MPAPQLATSSITSRIQRLSQQGSISVFDLKGVERDIEKLQKVNAGDAFMLFGMLYAAAGDYELSKSYHEKSLLLPHTFVELANYGISMRKVNRLQEAKELFCRALDRAPSSLNLFQKFVSTSTFLFDYREVDEVVDRFRKANPTIDVDNLDFMVTLSSIFSHLDKTCVSLDEYRLFGVHVEQVLQEFSVGCGNLQERLGKFDGVSHVYVELHVDVKEFEMLVSMNDRLAELVLLDDRIECWDRVVLNFSRGSAPVPEVDDINGRGI